MSLNISLDALKNIEKKRLSWTKKFFSVLRLPHPLPLLHLATGLVKRNLIRSFRITPLSNKFPILHKKLIRSENSLTPYKSSGKSIEDSRGKSRPYVVKATAATSTAFRVVLKPNKTNFGVQ